VNVADAVSLLGFLFGGGQAAACPDSGAAKDDASLNIAEAIHILTFLLVGEELSPPSPECGPDLTAGELAECNYPQEGC